MQESSLHIGAPWLIQAILIEFALRASCFDLLRLAILTLSSCNFLEDFFFIVLQVLNKLPGFYLNWSGGGGVVHGLVGHSTLQVVMKVASTSPCGIPDADWLRGAILILPRLSLFKGCFFMIKGF